MVPVDLDLVPLVLCSLTLWHHVCADSFLSEWRYVLNQTQAETASLKSSKSAASISEVLKDLIRSEFPSLCGRTCSRVWEQLAHIVSIPANRLLPAAGSVESLRFQSRMLVLTHVWRLQGNGSELSRTQVEGWISSDAKSLEFKSWFGIGLWKCVYFYLFYLLLFLLFICRFLSFDLVTLIHWRIFKCPNLKKPSGITQFERKTSWHKDFLICLAGYLFTIWL